MRHPSIRYYLYCQAIGWGTLTLILVIFNPVRSNRWPLVAEFILPGLLITHLLRATIRHYHWLDLPIRRTLTRVLPTRLLALAAAALIRSTMAPSLQQQSSAAGPAIDVEDLTSALDRIRSLIDQDPNSARREITTFSRLLRSGHLKS